MSTDIPVRGTIPKPGGIARLANGRVLVTISTRRRTHAPGIAIATVRGARALGVSSDDVHARIRAQSCGWMCWEVWRKDA